MDPQDSGVCFSGQGMAGHGRAADPLEDCKRISRRKRRAQISLHCGLTICGSGKIYFIFSTSCVTTDHAERKHRVCVPLFIHVCVCVYFVYKGIYMYFFVFVYLYQTLSVYVHSCVCVALCLCGGLFV